MSDNSAAPQRRALLPDLSPDEVRRYSRHLLLPEVGRGRTAGAEGRQGAVRWAPAASGSPIAMYLAAAGVGTLGIVDYDVVDYSNLQRQLLHMTRDVGRPKVESAAERLRAINPDIRVEPHRGRARAPSTRLISSPATTSWWTAATTSRRATSSTTPACLSAPAYVYGSIFRFEGQAAVFAAPGGPCYRCLYPEPPPPDLVPTCAEGGVLGVLPGMIGTIQANEAIKLILGIGEPLVGRLLLARRAPDALPRSPAAARPGLPGVRRPPGDSGTAGLRGLLRHAAHRRAGARRARGDAGLRHLATRAEDGDGRRRTAPVLLDVREPMEFRINRLPGAVLVPLAQLPDALSQLDQTARLRRLLPPRHPECAGGRVPPGGRAPGPQPGRRHYGVDRPGRAGNDQD